MNRGRDRLKQALRDLEHARKSIDLRDYDWACFSSQQAAEKALKAVYLSLGMEAWGHDLTNLLRGLRELTGLRIPKRLRECAAELDKHYVISRYPNGFAVGAPWEHYTRKDAVKRVKSGERIIEWAKVLLRVNREEVIRRLKEFKERVVRKYSNIKSVILVGSVATNTHTVRSDVDVVVIYEGREPNYAYLK